MHQSWTSGSPLSIPVCYSISTDEWKTAMEFLTRTGQISTRSEFSMLSYVLGATALLETLNNPQVGKCDAEQLHGPVFY